MDYIGDSRSRLGRRQQVVTLTTVSLATPTQVVAIQSNVQSQTVQSVVPSVKSSSGVEGNLSTGWIVAVVSLVLLAISLTYIAYQRWGGKSKSSGTRNRRSVYDRSSSYYEISKPARTRDRSRSRRR